jgi:hypothetical protein
MSRIKQPGLTPDALLAQVRRMMEIGQRKLSQDDLDAVDKLTLGLEEKIKEAQAWTIAILGDHPLPIAFYEPWASYMTIFKAERAGTLTTVERRNGKLLLTPANFFAWFGSIPADKRRKAHNRKSEA